MIIDPARLTISCTKCNRKLTIHLDDPDLSTREQHQRMVKMHRRCTCGALTESMITQTIKATAEETDVPENNPPADAKEYLTPLGRLMELNTPAEMRRWAYYRLATIITDNRNDS